MSKNSIFSIYLVFTLHAMYVMRRPPSPSCYFAPPHLFTFVAAGGFGEIPCFAVLLQSTNTPRNPYDLSVLAPAWTDCVVTTLVFSVTPHSGIIPTYV